MILKWKKDLSSEEIEEDNSKFVKKLNEVAKFEVKFNKKVDKFNFTMNDVPLLAGTSHLIAIMYRIAKENNVPYSWKFFMELLDLLILK